MQEHEYRLRFMVEIRLTRVFTYVAIYTCYIYNTYLESTPELMVLAERTNLCIKRNGQYDGAETARV